MHKEQRLTMGIAATIAAILALLAICAISPTKALASTSKSAGASLRAEESGTGELLVMPTNSNVGVEYGVYQIFKASSTGSGALYGFEWPSPEMSRIVTETIKAEKPSFSDTSAQGCAEFIADNLGTNGLGETIADKGSFAWRLASAICKANPSHGRLRASQAGSYPSGYYLVMTDSFSGADNESGVSPMFVTVIAGKRRQVGEKTGVPTIVKQVKEHDSKSWGKRTVSGTGEDIEFLLTITLPSNYATFPSYCIEVTDEMENMRLRSKDDVHVSVDGKGISQFEVSYDGDQRFVVRIDDLKSAAPSATMESVVTVRYVAHLVPGAQMGSDGNRNTATLRYTRNPGSSDLGRATPSSADVYSLGLRILKTETGKKDSKLEGAEFTVALASGANANEDEYDGYVTSDGSISKSPSSMMTDKDGMIFIPNIPSGTFIISEKAAPKGYKTIDGNIAVTLSTKSSSQTDKTESGPYDIETTLTGNHGHVTIDAEESATTGIATVSIENDKAPESDVPPTPSEPTPSSEEPSPQTPSDTVPSDTHPSDEKPSSAPSSDVTSATPSPQLPALATPVQAVPKVVNTVVSNLLQTGQGRTTAIGVMALVAGIALLSSDRLRRASEAPDGGETEPKQ